MRNILLLPALLLACEAEPAGVDGAASDGAPTRAHAVAPLMDARPADADQAYLEAPDPAALCRNGIPGQEPVVTGPPAVNLPPPDYRAPVVDDKPSGAGWVPDDPDLFPADPDRAAVVAAAMDIRRTGLDPTEQPDAYAVRKRQVVAAYNEE